MTINKKKTIKTKKIKIKTIFANFLHQSKFAFYVTFTRPLLIITAECHVIKRGDISFSHFYFLFFKLILIFTLSLLISFFCFMKTKENLKKKFGWLVSCLLSLSTLQYPPSPLSNENWIIRNLIHHLLFMYFKYQKLR